MRLLALAVFVLVLAFATPARSRAAPCARVAAVASATVQISEVEADPVLGGTDTANEWFELTNVGGSTITLTGWSVADSASSDPLPSLTLGPGRCAIVAATAAGFLAEHAGYGLPVAAISDGAIGNGLSNSGDVLTLLDPAASAVDCVAWGSATGCFSPPLAATAANTAITLQRTSATDSDTAADWAAAPETQCSVAATAVRIASLRAVRLRGGAVRVSWRAALTPDVVAFRLWRTDGSRFVRVARLAAGRASGVYTYLDRRALRNGGGAYRLQAILLDGRGVWFGPVRPG
jgi:Lamin Tail Domain